MTVNIPPTHYAFKQKELNVLVNYVRDDLRLSQRYAFLNGNDFMIQ